MSYENMEKLRNKLISAIEAFGLETDFKGLTTSEFLGVMEIVKLNYIKEIWGELGFDELKKRNKEVRNR